MIKKLFNKQSFINLVLLLKTVITIFIFLSWCIVSVGTDDAHIIVCFILAILFSSSHLEESILPAILGALVLPSIRNWFLIPKKTFLYIIPFPKPFTFWDHQTACAGMATWLIFFSLIKLWEIISGKSKK